ncbi:MAG: acyl carrier protein [Gemmatimonadales bacterium]
MTVGKDDIQKFISDEVSMLLGSSEATINADTPLIGHNRVLDSADLVVLLLAVEDYASDNLGFDWDWTSDSAMSEARSVLRNIGSLADHLMNQQPA